MSGPAARQGQAQVVKVIMRGEMEQQRREEEHLTHYSLTSQNSPGRITHIEYYTTNFRLNTTKQILLDSLLQEKDRRKEILSLQLQCRWIEWF